MTAPVPARLHQPSRQPEGDGGRERPICAGMTLCVNALDRHNKNCPAATQ